MFKTFVIAAITAISATAAVTAPALADRYCGPGFYYSHHYAVCRPYAYNYAPGGVVGGAVGTAGYVAGSAVNTAGYVAGTAINTAGAIAGGVLGAVTGR